ncbi:MAG: hypothetical protein M1823_000185 [Watsoniomyces obsoletus]|nr:MAG: hypothetical protein M1823_000185 [Watsoniomyces obsoletus]
MAPIRRYLRITKYSVLECRIYLENPGLADTWLLNARDPILPRVMESVRPLVLPKLREENERAKGKGKKATKGIKDVVTRDDFEVAIFLTDPSTRHSLLKKQKFYRDPTQGPRPSSRNITGLGSLAPTEDNPGPGSPIVIREEDEDEATPQNIPPARGSEDDETYIIQDSDSENERPVRTRQSKRHQETRNVEGQRSRRSHALQEPSEPMETEDDEGKDSKKLIAQVTYDGYSIYGRILCLVVKRRQKTVGRAKAPTAPAMVEDWIQSTQVEAQED